MPASPSPPPRAPFARPADSADWIVAPATAPGPGAIAIVRVDGPGCWQAVGRVWRPLSSAASPAPPPEARRLTLGTLTGRDGRAVDECLLAWFPGPHSYTGNDLAELHCHGGPAVVAAVVDALLAAGARPARPGEFTERAFLNGRMDLAEAEAVAALVAARTEAAARAALAQLEGGLSREVTALREALLDAAAEIEARLDFPEDEIASADATRLADALAQARDRAAALLATERRGRLLHEGARVVIAGRPNTGKSSLFNALVGRERALVTPHPGTTRDTIEATLDLAGMPILLVDTAGVRGDGAGEIEALGIERSLRELRQADLVLLVLDATQLPTAEDRGVLAEAAGRPVVVVANKCDLAAAQSREALRGGLWPADAIAPSPMIRVSALLAATLAPLEQALATALLGPGARGEEGVLVTNERQAGRLRIAHEALTRAVGLMAGHAPGRVADIVAGCPPEGGTTYGPSALPTDPMSGPTPMASPAPMSAAAPVSAPAPGEIVMVEINEALTALGEIVGLAVGEEVLDRIFSRFCIGK